MSVLVGDRIENPGNVAALQDAAALFGWRCAFLDPCASSSAAARVTAEELAAFAPLVALENAPGAAEVYGFRPPPGPRLGLVVGNERAGVSRDVLALAARTVEIPLASRRLNTLNVAAAAAVGLYYLSRDGGGRQRVRSQPERHRPEVLFMAPDDAVELGSSLRSAGAFGWSRVLVEDTRGVWFGGDRATQSLGRGAARRGRNELRVVPAAPDRHHAFDEAIVVTAGDEGEPLHRIDLARGRGQLVVLANGAIDAPGRLARTVRVASLGLRGDGARRLRLVASIALAEVARQVGVRGARPGRRPQRPPTYDCALRTAITDDAGQLVCWTDLP